jgi:NAD(P)-dependent dehydrogenase (short-subunit alcohol dehydrogenase family)
MARSSMMLLKDKVCVIVGAGSSRGIGYATAQLFAQHGAKIVVVDVAIDVVFEEEFKASLAQSIQADVEIHTLRCDIRSIANCKQMVEAVIARFGRIDCLVNSAGIVSGKPLLSIEERDYDLMLDVNLKGAFNVCQSVLPVLVAQQSGTIVNLSSLAAQRGGGLVGGAHYAASKGGVISLTRTIAREFGASNIRANVVCPAMIETAMLDGITAEKLKEITDAIPLKRTGLAREVAGACLFLSSELSGFVTGATIDVNGGTHIH